MLIPEIQTIRGSALYNPVSLHSVLLNNERGVVMTNEERYKKYIDENCKHCKNRCNNADLCEIRIFVCNDVIITKCVCYERED